MATLKVNDIEKEIPDGGPLKDACKEAGIPFGCENGLCGTCLVEVEEGMENLTERSEAEESMGVDGKNRLACQCQIKQGLVQIKY